MAAKKLTRAAKYSLMYGDAGGYMSHLSHADRVRVKQAAAKRGLTISGLLQGGPEALRERSTAGLRAQALKTVSSAYAPAEADLGSRVSQANALDEKRRTDNQYYADWLATQQHTADAASQASDAALLAQASQLHGEAQAAGNAQQQQAAQQAQATPGNVSDPSQSSAINGLAANTTKAVGAADIANAEAVGQVARSGASRATSAASNVASIAALEARRQGDTYKTLAGLSDESGKLKLSKAADMSKEIARLLDEEVSKAQSAQQTGILAQKLGVTQATLNEKAAHDRSTSRQSAAKLRHQEAVDRHTQMLADSKFKLDQAKYGDTKAKDIYQRQHKLGPYAPPSKKNAAADVDQKKRSRTGVSNILQLGTLTSSRYAGNYGTYKKAQLKAGVNISLINAGWQYAHGGITKGTARNLRAQGIVVPKNMLRGG
jgi:hypothetical protein